MMRSTEDHKLATLARSPLFDGLSQSELALLGTITDEIDFAEGRTLIREGEIPHEFFVIIEGEADVSKGGNHLRTVGPGEFIGDVSLVAQTTRTATVTTTTPMRVFVMTEQAFRSLIATNREVESKVLRSIAKHLLAASGMLS